MTTRLMVSLVVSATTLPIAATAKDQPAVLKALLECRAIAEGTARLTCYDRSTSSLEVATRNGDVLVADRAEVREAKRQVFGFGGIRLPFLGNDDAAPTQIEASVKGLRDTGHGKWEFTLDNGMVWRQTDDEPIFPKSGDKVVVKTAAMGSYMLKLRTKAVRVMRVR